MIDLIKTTFRDIWQQKLRSIVVASGALWGVMVLVGLYTPVRAFEQEIQEILDSFNTQRTFQIKGPTTDQLDPGKINNIIGRFPDEWTGLPFVFQRMEIIRKNSEGTVQHRDRDHVAGVPTWKGEAVKLPVTSGSWFTEQQHQNSEKVCVIGREIASENEISEPGEQLFIGGQPYRVQGILGAPPGLQDEEHWNRFPDRIIFVPLKSFPVPLDRAWSPRVRIRVIIPDSADLYEEMDRAEKLFPELNVEHAVARQQYDKLKKHMSRWKKGLWVVIGICLLMGGFGLMILMLSSVKQRFREVGIRRAVGANRIHIVVQFLVESTVLSLLGGILGVAAGAGIGYVSNKIIGVPFMVDLYIWGIGLLASMLLGVFFGTYPAYRAATMDPVRALRYE